MLASQTASQAAGLRAKGWKYKGSAMTHDYGLPSSMRLELEARRMYAQRRSDRGAAPGLALALVVRRFPDAFDLSVWVVCAVAVFPRVFFPSLDREAGVLAGLLLGALGVAVRPLGAMIFARVARRHGRGVRLTAAQFLVGASTAAVAFLPDQTALGWTSIGLLCALRLLQGLAAGGAWNGAVASAAPTTGRKGGAGTATVAGICLALGLLLGVGLLLGLRMSLSATDFLDWGWRYPFFIAFAINIVALFAQLRLLAAQPT
jgi:MFS family permease